VSGERGGQRGEAVAIEPPAPRDLAVVAEAGERRNLRRRRDVERPPHLRHRGDAPARADRVPDAQRSEAVDLRERPQHDDAAPPPTAPSSNATSCRSARAAWSAYAPPSG